MTLWLLSNPAAGDDLDPAVLLPALEMEGTGLHPTLEIVGDEFKPRCPPQAIDRVIDWDEACLDHDAVGISHLEFTEPVGDLEDPDRQK